MGCRLNELEIFDHIDICNNRHFVNLAVDLPVCVIKLECIFSAVVSEIFLYF